MLVLEKLIGKRLSEDDVQSFLNELEKNPHRDKFADLNILDYPSDGVTVYYTDDECVDTIFLHSNGHEYYLGYVGALPYNLLFTDSREKVAKKLGNPSLSGVETPSNAPWQRFDYEHYSLHIKYFQGFEGIQMITLMSTEIALGK